MAGRLTLSWANKHDALISTPDGGYEWVDPSDPRANEVRLLDEVDRVGDVTGTARDNLLVRGDGLDALRALKRIPEYAEEYKGKVKLVYIDPPFNTGQAFEHYDDGLEHSVWLGMMRERLDLIADLLAPDGSVWVHLDDAEMAYARVLMDEIFGRSNFVASVIWKKIHARNNTAMHFSADHDFILVYAKDASRFRVNRVPRTEASDGDFWNPDNDPRGDWRRSDLTASHAYSEGKYEVTGPHGETFAPRENRWWGLSRENFDQLVADDRIWWGKTGRTFPFRKRFRSELGDLVPTTVWLNDEVGDNREAKQHITKVLGRGAIFSTPKPERLLQRIVHIASDPGDIVVDVFAGSGTTAAVAHKMGRRWVTAEVLDSTVDKFTLPRLREVVHGKDAGGITPHVSWSGGGGFRELRIAQPVFEVADLGGLTVTSTVANMTGAVLARSVAAQLGYSASADDEPPFAGRKGRSRLAVIRGVLDTQTVASLLAGIEDDETLTIAATGAEPDTRTYLRQYSRGSRIVRIPDGLFPKNGVKR